jgi:hypothetical protein
VARAEQTVISDFERYGIATGDVRLLGRSFLLTIDFEAFEPDTVGDWTEAMMLWSEATGEGQWKSCVFIALEDVVRLRITRPVEYDRFLAAARCMAAAGATFYPHNHGVFSESTGLLAASRPERIAGYPKRASMFFDVVYRHGIGILDWLDRLGSFYEVFLDDTGLAPPAQLAFRAGGWDHGATEADARAFVDALATTGYSWDSSASAGLFGTRSWRVGAPYGRNVFGLGSDLTEAAPCWFVDASDRLHDPGTARAALTLLTQPRLWRGQPGALVAVLHFHNLFQRDSGGGSSAVRHRIRALFQKLAVVRTVLHLSSVTFDELRLTCHHEE